MDHIFRAPLPECHAQRIEHDLRVQRGGHRPAHDPPAEDIEHDGEVEEPRPRRYVRNISHPQHILPFSDKLPIDEIGSLMATVPHRRGDELATADAGEACRPHQPRHAPPADADARLGQVELDARHTVGAPRGRVRSADLLRQLGVRYGTRRWRTLDPCVIAAGGDTQGAAHHGDGVAGPVLAHELPSFPGILFVSRANQAAAFERISLSNLS